MWLSILGIYNNDNTIFEGLNVPDGLTKDDVTENILIECAELEIVYTDPVILKRAIEIWSISNQFSWNKLYKSMSVEYNPIWNVDADITETIDRNREDSIDATDVNSVKGFNSNTWAEANKDDQTGKSNTDEDIVRTERRTGNIGVTATQDLIKKEREVAVFNMIEFITNSFKERFCIMIY